MLPFIVKDSKSPIINYQNIYHLIIMIKRKPFIQLLLLAGLLLTVVTACDKTDDQSSDSPSAETVKDADGNIYNTIKIGSQIWMAENLKTTKYRNGDPIEIVTDNSDWANLSTGAYCNYNNETSNSSTYGRLYNWYAVSDSRNIAPIGWHVPTDAEWKTLTTYLGGEIVAGGKLKEIGTTHWKTPNSGADNSTSFTALPGGYRFSSIGTFTNIGMLGDWWSSTANYEDSAYLQFLIFNMGTLYRDYGYKGDGFSVRCIKD